MPPIPPEAAAIARRGTPIERFTPSEVFEGMRSDYAATKQNRYTRRRTGILPTGSHADWHYRVETDYLRLGESARDMDRNDAIVGTTVDKAVLNTIQGGIHPDPKTGDPQIDAELKARWKDWADDPDQCDEQQEKTFHEIESIVYRDSIVVGDIFGIGMKSGHLRLMEQHRCRTPSKTTRNVVHGVLLDEYRRRLEYWFTKEDISASSSVELVGQTAPIPARDAAGNRQVMHVYNPRRMSQTRGVTAFAPIFETLSGAEDIQFAKIVQQQVVSCFAIFRQRESSFQSDAPAPTGNQFVEPNPRGSGRTIQGIAPGMEIAGQPGEKLEGFSPNVPNNEYFPHIRLILTMVGINIGMPLVMVLMEPGGSFSAYRGAVDQARLGFRQNQRWLVNRFHKPTYEFKVRQWIAEDRALRMASELKAINMFGCRWNPPSWPYIDPTKDPAADLLRVRNGLTSNRRLHAERGTSWDEVFPEIIDDNFQAIFLARTRAKEMNDQIADGQPIHWRELLPAPTPDGILIKIAGEDDSEGDEQGDTPPESPSPSRPQPKPKKKPKAA